MKNGCIGFGKAWLMVALISWTQLSLAQDPHFSQYISAPLLLNPAQAGLINGSYRINLNYRDQWNKIEGSDYKTVAFSGDMNFIPPLKGFRNDLMGIGLSFLSDKSPGFDFNTNELAMYVAYHKRTGKNQFLSFGTKLGILQRGVNYENLTFGDQYVEGSGYSNNSRSPAGKQY
ncbi:MAG: PorP/SprF family type IX secretion system membrane protein [Saprospiraceae bacterium]|nr:PorP/SprF family type IX secretion system membrane protein [Saprospiraceae bacterium]